jgi:hypothetical protein
MTHTDFVLNYADTYYLNNQYDDYDIYNSYKTINSYSYSMNDFDNECNYQIQEENEKLNEIFYKLNAVMIFSTLYILAINTVYNLHMINKSYYTGNLSFRHYYQFYVNIFQKANEHKELVVRYLNDTSLQDLIRTNIEEDSLSFINLQSYYYARQKLFHKKLFHFGNKKYASVIDIDGYKTSIGELNYIIWLIESGLFTFFTKKRTLLENKKNNENYNYLKNNFFYKNIGQPVLSFLSDSYNGMYLYFENTLERQS